MKNSFTLKELFLNNSNTFCALVLGFCEPFFLPFLLVKVFYFIKMETLNSYYIQPAYWAEFG